MHGWMLLLRGGVKKERPNLEYSKIRWLNKLGGKVFPEEKPAKTPRPRAGQAARRRPNQAIIRPPVKNMKRLYTTEGMAICGLSSNPRAMARARVPF